MTLPTEGSLHQLKFYVTTAYSCGYLPKKLAQSLIATPQYLVDSRVYSGLIQQGFRRSGKFTYRPHCENCCACIPVRIPVADFVANRSQKRASKQHKNLTTHILPVGFRDGHYDLYHAYQRARHNTSVDEKDQAVEPDSIEQFQNFLCESNIDSVMVEFRENDELTMVSVIDIVQDGISAVYTFYDTSQTKSSYGTYNILWQIEWAKLLNLPYLYLGYFIQESPKMAYKTQYKPLQKLIEGDWVEDSDND